MPKQNQRIALTKRLLKEALLRLLKEKKLNQISITELCEEAEINRITFYRHYELPNDVLEEIGGDIILQMHQKLKPPKSLQDFERYIRDVCIYFHEQSETLLILFRCGSYMDFFEFVKEMYRYIAEQYSNLSEIQGYNDDIIRLTIAYSSGGWYFLLREWLTEEIQKTPEEVAALVYRLTSQGHQMAIDALNLTKNNQIKK